MTTASSFVEKLSKLFMEIGRSAPRFEKMALVYHQSRDLQTSLCEYFTLVVHLCHDVLKFTQKSHLAKIGYSLVDSSLEKYREELNAWGLSIRDQVAILQAERGESEARLNAEFRNDSTSFWQLSSVQQRLQARQRVLVFCSQYDHAVTWRHIRRSGTTNLFSQCIEYQTWKTNMKGKTLFFVGKLGSGKSVLLANLLDDLNLHLEQNDSCPVAYFFCRHDITESLNPRVIIGSIARQILAQVPDAETAIELIENAHGRDPLVAIGNILRRVLPSTHRPFIIIDGLDELDGTERETLVESLKHLQRSFHLSLCISVREDPANWLKTVPGQFLDPTVVPIPDNKPEIETFIKGTLEKHLQFSRITIGDPALILEIQDALVKGSQGMFLWAALQIEALRTMENDHAIRQALQDLPKDLSETFSRALKLSRRFSPTLQDKILSLITVAQRPLSPEEMRLALSIIPGKPIWDGARLPNDIYTGLSSCGGLVILDEDELTLHLVHHSVKQWLVSDSSKDADVITIQVETAHEEMTHKLITYLNYSQFENQVGRQVVPHVKSGRAMNTIISTTRSAASGSNKLALSLLRSNSTGGFNIGRSLAGAQKRTPSETISVLHDYATKYWTDHLPWCPNFPLPTKIHTLFQNLCSREGLANSKRAKTLLGLAVRHQSMALIRYIVESLDVDINSAVDDRHRTALHIACNHASERIVENLVNFNGIDVTQRDSSNDSPIYVALEGYLRSTSTALESKFTSIIKTLAATGQINYVNGTLLPLIEKLTTHAFQRLLMPLLDSIPSIGRRETIWYIVEEMIPAGEDITVRLLVEHKITPTLEGSAATRYFPLHLAVINKCMAKIEILLGSGKVSSWQADKSKQTPFHLAAAQGNLEAMRLLLYGKANLDIIPEPLFTSPKGIYHLPTVLLERAPSSLTLTPLGHNERDTYGNTALHLAIGFGHREAVELMLSLLDTNVNVGNFKGITPLHMAAKSGHLEIFSLIFKHSRRSITTVDSFQNRPLHLAAAAGHAHIISALLEDSFDMINYKNSDNQTPLHLAAMGGHVSALEILVAKRGVDLNAIDATGSTALHHATMSNNFKAVSLLVRKGADLWLGDQDNRTPLHLAAKRAHISIMELFICFVDEAVELDRVDSSGRTALHHAVLSNNCTAVELISKRGADTRILDEEGSTPFHYAARLGNYEIARSLLEVSTDLASAQDSKGRTSLHIAVLNDHLVMVAFLLRTGLVDVDKRDDEGSKAIDIAIREGYVLMERLILFHEDSTKS